MDWWRGLKGTSKNSWTIAFLFFSFSFFIIYPYWLWDIQETYFWEDKCWGIGPSTIYSLVYIIYPPSRTTRLFRSSIRRSQCLLLAWVSVAYWPTGKHKISWLFFLSFPLFCLSRGDSCLRTPSHSKGFSSSYLSNACSILFWWVVLLSSQFGRWSFLCHKFCVEELTPWIGTRLEVL